MIEIPFSGEAFQIFGIHVRWYGILMMAGVVLMVYRTWRATRNDPRISEERVLTAALIGVPSGIVFSRIVHIIDRWDYYGQHLNELVGGDGLTIWGAIIGATIGMLIYIKVSKFEAGARFMDLLAPNILLAQAIGRVGCILNGCCYGDTCTEPWAIIYTNPGSYAVTGIPVHPTQAYEIIYLLMAFGLIQFLKRWLKPEGSVFLTYLCLYSIWRIGIAYLRPGTDFLFGLHQAQVIGIIVLLIAVPWMINLFRKQKSVALADGLAQEDAPPATGTAVHLAQPGDILEAGQQQQDEGKDDIGHAVEAEPADKGKTDKSQ